VRGPFFNDEYNDRYSVLYALSAPELSMAELLAVTEDVKRRIQSVNSVAKVDVLGKQAERVFVEISTRRLASLGIAPAAVFDALARQNLVAPAGSADATHDRVQVRVDGGLRSAADVANVTLEVGGQLLRLADIATVRTGYEDPPSLTIRHNGVPVLAIGVTMQANGNVLDFGRALERAAGAGAAGTAGGRADPAVRDQPRVVAESVWEFERSFLEALAIVLAVSFLFLGWRTGIVVAASVPLVLGLVAAVMHAAGWALDRISLGALIIALGLLVDDAIIAVEMMVVKLEEGWDRLRAATYAYTTTALPMLTGTLITAAGFMPVGFAKSIAGQYAGGIFWVVGVALILSWLVAVIFTPYLGVLLLPKNLACRHAPRRLRPAHLPPAARRHRSGGAAPGLGAGHHGAGLRHRRCRHADGTAAVLPHRIAAGTAGGPETARRGVFRRDGAPGEAARGAAGERPGHRILHRLHRCRHATLLSVDPAGIAEPGVRTVRRQDGGYRAARTRARALMEPVRQGRGFAGRQCARQRLEFGPPVGFPGPVPCHRPGQGAGARDRLQVRDAVRQSPLVRDTQLDWNEQVRSMQVHVDQDKARLLGLSSCRHPGPGADHAGRRTGTQIRRGEELVDVVVRATPEERKRIGQLGDLHVFTRSGVTVPLSQVARVEPGFEEPVLWRRNRDMALTVRSDVVDGVQGPDATAKIRPSLQPIIDSLPCGLPHRGRRRHRGERQGQQGAVRGVPGDVRGDADAADDPAAELSRGCSWCS
jgi:multidrug efflux pump subunit AcrB